LILAEHCREACRLDRVVFIPAGRPPHKAERQITAGRQRLEMVELAIAGHAAFAASGIELERSGPSYSVETLADLARQNAGAELFFLMGSDSLNDLPLWYQPRRIASLATLVVATRPEATPPDLDRLGGVLGDDVAEQITRHMVEIPLVKISSSDIRRRVRAGQTIRFMVPRAVECYIETHELYGERPAESDSELADC
jgi:nicotinate-nucleotide adenylyltransferase